jgi:hypothetical protein
MMALDIFGAKEIHNFHPLESWFFINEQWFNATAIWQHYKIKHSHYINDELIINLLKQLHNTDYPYKSFGYLDKVNQKVLWKLYEYDKLYIDNKAYKLVWMIREDTKIFISSMLFIV